MKKLTSMLLLLCFVGCNDRPASRYVDYDTACAIDEDCAVVTYASCGLCLGCGEAAININEVDRFDDDNHVICPPRSEEASCNACQETVAVCIDGTCAMHVCDDVGVCAAP